MQRETLEVLYTNCLSRVYDDIDEHHGYTQAQGRADLRYLKRRIKHEGVRHVSSNLLPSFGRDVEKCLVQGGRFSCSDTSLELVSGSKLPKLLYWCTSQFLMDDGSLLKKEEQTPDMAYYIAIFRHIAFFGKKFVWEESDGVKEPLRNFSARISAVPNIKLSGVEVQRIRKEISEFLERHEAAIQQWVDNPWGRHGPGAVAEMEGPRGKWQALVGSHQMGPLVDGLGYLSTAAIDRRINSSYATLVPKDERGPRIICIEETACQFLQQGLMSVLYDAMARDPILREDISLTNQEPSRKLCRSLKYATIDLKDASDNISVAFARLVLPDWFLKVVMRLRSTQVYVDGEFIRSRALCTMGNALCFPLETLLFWGVMRSFINKREKVRVFGDDIIVPKYQVHRACDLLARCGFVVNLNKTCFRTALRESCGAVWWDGWDVSSSSPRLTCLDHRTDAVALSALTADLLQRELYHTAHAVEEIGHAMFPSFIRRRYNRDLQRLEQCVPQPCTSCGKTLTGEDALYAYFTGQQTCPPSKRDLRVKSGWISVWPSRA